MLKGIIFDMDGVISDTQKIHSQVESELLARYKIFISPAEITQRYAGVKTSEFFLNLFQKYKINCDLNALLKEKWQQMEQSAQKKVDSIPGAIKLIKKLKTNNYPLAIASTSYLNYVNTVLNYLKLKKYFSAIISGDMVKQGKPNPEIFLLAAQKINLNPTECLVIEDGINGMRAAQAAKMKCIGKDKNKSYPTKNLINSLTEIDIEYLKKLDSKKSK